MGTWHMDKDGSIDYPVCAYNGSRWGNALKGVEMVKRCADSIRG